MPLASGRVSVTRHYRSQRVPVLVVVTHVDELRRDRKRGTRRLDDVRNLKEKVLTDLEEPCIVGCRDVREQLDLDRLCAKGGQSDARALLVDEWVCRQEVPHAFQCGAQLLTRRAISQPQNTLEEDLFPRRE